MLHYHEKQLQQKNLLKRQPSPTRRYSRWALMPLVQPKPHGTTQPNRLPEGHTLFTRTIQKTLYGLVFQPALQQHAIGPDARAKHARLAQSVERETLTSTRSQGCGFDPRIGLFL